MGTWAVDAFGNDDACDWAFGLEEETDLSLVEAALEAATVKDADYIEAPTAWEALAACEVIARLQGNGGAKSAYSAPVDTWVAAHNIKPSSQLSEKAYAAIARILSDKSELKELWADSEDYQQWLTAVDELKNRISL